VPVYDALLVVSFGGPEKHDDVIPFLENVLRGRNVPRERMLAVAEHYYHFGGRSPINDQNRELVSKLREALGVPVYWGNRNWHPMLAETVRQMRDDGVRRAAALATSAFGSYSGCRQYQEDIDRALAEVGDSSLRIDKLPPFSDHPLFIEAMTDRVKDALSSAIEWQATRSPAPQSPAPQLVFTAHSVPVSMAQSSPYVAQLERACARVAAGVGHDHWRLVYQSRSGAPGQPWLDPDICDELRANPVDTIIVPIGFLSDHMEVLYDLDTEARAVCEELGVRMVRAKTVGTHPAMIRMIAEMLEREAVACRADCCAAPRRPPQ
jgi:protoporphyrin/coproporphyrin ferrochelatase